jgi:4-hydroxy-3-polyprenylbenzoate decarboxylase
MPHTCEGYSDAVSRESENYASSKKRTGRIVLAITGASGAVYGIRTFMALMAAGTEIHLCVSGSGLAVLRHECGWDGNDLETFMMSLCDDVHPSSSFSLYNENDFFSPPASGSFLHSGMAIVPCSMKTLGSVANGITGNLIHRAADVCLKERRRLIMVVRETPLNLVHIENMRKLTLAGGVVMPASPSFYSFPETVESLVDTVVARILDHLGINNSVMKRWGG